MNFFSGISLIVVKIFCPTNMAHPSHEIGQHIVTTGCVDPINPNKRTPTNGEYITDNSKGGCGVLGLGYFEGYRRTSYKAPARDCCLLGHTNGMRGNLTCNPSVRDYRSSGCTPHFQEGCFNGWEWLAGETDCSLASDQAACMRRVESKKRCYDWAMEFPEAAWTPLYNRCSMKPNDPICKVWLTTGERAQEAYREILKQSITPLTLRNRVHRERALMLRASVDYDIIREYCKQDHADKEFCGCVNSKYPDAIAECVDRDCTPNSYKPIKNLPDCKTTICNTEFLLNNIGGGVHMSDIQIINNCGEDYKEKYGIPDNKDLPDKDLPDKDLPDIKAIIAIGLLVVLGVLMAKMIFSRK